MFFGSKWGIDTRAQLTNDVLGYHPNYCGLVSLPGKGLWIQARALVAERNIVGCGINTDIHTLQRNGHSLLGYDA
jgi:hypothetical protein